MMDVDNCHLQRRTVYGDVAVAAGCTFMCRSVDWEDELGRGGRVGV